MEVLAFPQILQIYKSHQTHQQIPQMLVINQTLEITLPAFKNKTKIQLISHQLNKTKQSQTRVSVKLIKLENKFQFLSIPTAIQTL